MSILFYIAACLVLVACSDDDEKAQRARYAAHNQRQDAKIQKYEKERIRSEQGKILLEAERDTLRKHSELLLQKNDQLRRENAQVKKEAERYRRDNSRLQKKVGQLQEVAGQLQEDKRTSEREIRRLAVEIDNISADRDRLIGVNQDLKNKLYEVEEELEDVYRIQKSVRLLIGTESFLKRNGFLKTSRKNLLQKQYKLVKKLDGDSRVKIVPLNERLDLTLDSVPDYQVNRPAQLKLKNMVDRNGKLKAGRDYTIRRRSNAAIITFINRDLEGTDVLAVVEIKN